jgi:hypothetical protein
VQRLVVADGEANASGGKPEQEMMPPQHDSYSMAFFLSSGSHSGFRLGQRMHAVSCGSMLASDGRLAEADQLKPSN